MKKIILSLTLVATISISIMSCTPDCYFCKTSGDEVNVCKTDYASSKEYTEAIKKLRALGFTCK
ncbi:MAG: hypothetical protein WCP57_04025 [Bacteroidota bacterium]